MIILSGLGINYKTTILNKIKELYPKIKISTSKTELYNKMNDTLDFPLGLYSDKILFEYLRLQFSGADIYDRGPEDAFCFDVLKGEGELPNIYDYNWTKVVDHRTGYINLMKSVPAKRYFIMNTNEANLERIIWTEVNNCTNRSVVYSSVDDYLVVQSKFYNVYKSIGVEHELIKFSSDDIDNDINNFINLCIKPSFVTL